MTTFSGSAELGLSTGLAPRGSAYGRAHYQEHSGSFARGMFFALLLALPLWMGLIALIMWAFR